jgi:hypothetical protein
VIAAEVVLRTRFVLDERGRMVVTREPGGARAPALALVRGAAGSAWAVRDDVDDEVAAELARLGATEPAEWRAPPVHAARYRALLGGDVVAGPVFGFPDGFAQAGDVVEIADEAALARHFHGWVPGEIADGRAPVMAIVEGGAPVSVCFCARRADDAAEAGVETAPGFRGRGLAGRVTLAWAREMRAAGRVPIYSTSWENAASLAVARKLGLVQVATSWQIVAAQ